MTSRRTSYEIYWEILVYCRTPRSFTAIIGRCDLNSRTGQEYLAFLTGKGYLETARDGDRTLYSASERAADYVRLFSELYQKLYNENPGFRL